MIEIDELIRSKRKTLSVSVNALGKVTVRAPLRATQKEIERFLTTHEQWIAKKKSTAKESGVRLPQNGIVGYKLLLLGNEYELCLHAQTRVVVDGENKRLYLPEKNTEKHLIRWLKDNALRICKQAVEKQSARMGVSPVSVSVTSARSFWGICTEKNELRFSYRLLYVPKAVFEYVIVHELAHIQYKNHSRAFWDEVAKFEPNWKEKRAYLKTHALLMRVF